MGISTGAYREAPDGKMELQVRFFRLPVAYFISLITFEQYIALKTCSINIGEKEMLKARPAREGL